MGWLLPALTPERFETQRGVVLNERRQSYENKPYGLAQFAIARALVCPKAIRIRGRRSASRRTSTRHRSTTSATSSRATTTRPTRRSSSPATSIAADAFAMVEDLFAEIPAGPAVPAVPRRPVPASSSRHVLEDRVDLPRLYLSWPSPPLFEAGRCRTRSGGGHSRERPNVALVSAAGSRAPDRDRTVRVRSRRASSCSTFQVVATAAPGESLDDVACGHRRGDRSRCGTPGPPATISSAAARRQRRRSFIGCSRSAVLAARADQLNAYNVYLGNPDGFDTDLARYLSATPETIAGSRHAVDRSRRAPTCCRWCRRDGQNSHSRRRLHEPW